MSFLHTLKLRFSPPKITDPDFGNLVYIYVPNAPERSYWECEWNFTETKTLISIGLPGSEHGPLPESRQFFLNLPKRFPEIVELARPRLQEAFATWLEQDLPKDIFTAVKLSGFGLETPKAKPIQWDIAFEATGEKWLGIRIPFTGENAQEAVVDT